MKNLLPRRIKTISEFHQYRTLPPPKHPLISLIDFTQIQPNTDGSDDYFVQEFYSISLKRTSNMKIMYGQQQLDFDAGVLFFMCPQQVLNIQYSASENKASHTGWLLLIHPDFLWNTSLGKTIKNYEFFDYAVNEALFLSEKEELILLNIMDDIQDESNCSIDKFSQNIIVSQIETLLNYSERFYQRQFITRQKSSHQTLRQFISYLDEYFDREDIINEGLPSVKAIAASMQMSPKYLSGLLTSLTGKTTQQHIHDKLISKAKEMLFTTTLTVSEIAYELGFERTQSFNKLFKSKTNLTPLEFKKSVKDSN
ncbi:helix-turn-helix domain-containing protein [Rhizosphaericola mali]|uniref:Helix-turn-helix transcriptional regulator n=1 Tax=Rhizosphaericola mali TaxID=2545455 RepID=A0A5P2G570_9BACT|nr:AraC family transcriptional regulator [Rhizosphaericola mali]QES88243.1 helix-turn-helix transcriptional regulator [Rhizosphaericola mali]